MSDAVFKRLLDIKVLRERSAATAVAIAEQSLEEAVEGVRAAKEELEDFEDYRKEEEERLFNTIKGMPVAVDAIDMMKFQVGLLRQETTELEKLLNEAETVEKNAQTELRRAETAHQETQRAVEKFQMLEERQAALDASRAADAEEAEIEETSEASYFQQREAM